MSFLGEPERSHRLAWSVVLAVVATGCVVCAVLVGTTARSAGGVRCGTGFAGVDNASVRAAVLPPSGGRSNGMFTPAQELHEACNDAVASPRFQAYVLLGIAALAVVGDLGLAAVTLHPRRPWRPA